MNKSYHFPKKTIRDIAVHGKRILVRADFNVPLTEDGKIASDYRITQTLPTLQYLLERGCSVVVIAHLGRPEGLANKKYTLEPIAERLQELLPTVEVQFEASLIDDKARQACKALKPGELLLLENLRFDPREEANDSEFAQAIKMVSGAAYFVQDGFGVVHRAHASTEAITHLLPSVAGLLLEKEVSTLEKAMQHPQHPVVAVVGGAKISDKIEFIERLLSIADKVLIGGAMANTFLKQQGHPIGSSVYEEGQEEEIATILQKSQSDQLVMPVDVAVSTEIAKKSQKTICNLDDVKSGEYVLDLGPKTVELFQKEVDKAATIIWNGTLGYAELPQFAESSAALADVISRQHGATSIIGGGDTADFVLDWQAAHPKAEFTHVSTGGGASLELMSGLKLPGLEALIS
ncbi:MAG: phosphoglycerate kinase [Candidatus Saccharimonadales bacterium]